MHPFTSATITAAVVSIIFSVILINMRVEFYEQLDAKDEIIKELWSLYDKMSEIDSLQQNKQHILNSIITEKQHIIDSLTLKPTSMSNTNSRIGRIYPPQSNTSSTSPIEEIAYVINFDTMMINYQGVLIQASAPTYKQFKLQVEALWRLQEFAFDAIAQPAETLRKLYHKLDRETGKLADQYFAQLKQERAALFNYTGE